MKNHLIIISESASFPWGMAASNRVRNLAKSAIIEEWHVTYLGLRGADVTKEKNRKYGSRGLEAGICFFYPGIFSLRPSNWWFRRMDDLIGGIFTFFFMLRKKITNKVDAVIFYSRNEIVTGFWIPLLHILRIPVILEICEWPLAIAAVQGYGYKKAERYCRNIVPSVDAVLPISKYINNEIVNITKKKNRFIPSFQIPILIDVERKFNTDNNENKKFLLYCGSISYMDIAMTVVDIVCELKNRSILLPVKFTGTKNDPRISQLKQYAKQKKVLSHFEFTGFIEEEELFKLMRQATCLLAPLPRNLQSEARFPTKIGYYLASGSPLLTNNVGEIDSYLKDEVNAFVISDYNVVNFANKIEKIINQNSLAKRVGLAGQDLAFEKFYYPAACKGFGDFLKKVVENKKSQGA